MKAFRLFVRGAAKVVGGIAALLFFVAPVTEFGGWMLMAGSVAVATVCVGAYKWAEPDENDEPLG